MADPGDYVRGTLVVAAFHGVVILVTLTILGVPLAFPWPCWWPSGASFPSSVPS